MFKINSYALFFVAAPFLGSASTPCCFPARQRSSHNNLNSAFLHKNPSPFVSNTLTHHTNFYSLPNSLLPTHSSSTQPQAAHPQVVESLVLNGLNVTNVNNTTLFLIPCGWNFNTATNTLFGANNNTLLLTPPNVFPVLTNANNVVAPVLPMERPSSTIAPSANTNTNNKNTSLLTLDEQSSSNTTDTSKTSLSREKTSPHKYDWLNKFTNAGKKKTYMCPKFNKMFANSNSYKYDVGTHDLNREKPYHCNICSKSFVRKQNLKVHTRIHTGEKPFTCPICGKGLSSKDALKNHINKHKGKKPYQCQVCQKRFRQKNSLKEHLKLHKDEKPYKCDQCTSAYTTMGGLKYHLKTHNKPKPYICHYCEATFAHKSEYEQHIRYEKSTDEDRKCHLCKKVYLNKYNLKRHNKKAHPRINY